MPPFALLVTVGEVDVIMMLRLIIFKLAMKFFLSMVILSSNVSAELTC